MADTLKMQATATVKAARFRLIGTIVVAALGLFGTLASIYVSMISASSDSFKASQIEQKELIDRLDEIIIPNIEKNLNDLLEENKLLHEKLGDARERLSKLEGRFSNNSVTGHWLTGELLESFGAPKKMPIKKREQFKLPTVQQKR